ncbi:MAG: hypothetical protein SF028_04580 [Candidatus Sumerlaeia bacterium]|nr:hypothetical protein [Candidatus Sumerlaeia bacterium]
MMRNLLATAAALAVCGGAAQAKFTADVVIDGTGISTTDYTSVALQTAGDSCFGTGIRAGELFLANDNANLYVGIAGDLQNDSVYLFFDTLSGGATNVAASPAYGEFEVLAATGGGNMPSGFEVDYIYNLKEFERGLGRWNVQANTANFVGNNWASNVANGAGYKVFTDNSNTTATPWAAGTVSTGIELQIPRTEIGSPSTLSIIRVFLVMGNSGGGGAQNTTYLTNQVLPQSPNVVPACYGRNGSGGGDGPGLNYDATGLNITAASYTLQAAADVSNWYLM